MRWFIIILLVLHGAIHLMGFAKAFGLAELPQLVQPIGRGAGVLWLAATCLTLAAAACLLAAPRWWWVPGALALVASQAAIMLSWSDAKFGTLPNVVILVAVAYGFLSQGPMSYRAEYAARADAELARPPVEGTVTETDLAPLPAPVARYVRVSGAIGQPRVFNFRARFSGKIRGGPQDAWMTFTGEQINRIGDAPSRLFFIDARMRGLPVDVFHAFVNGSATMRAKACSAVKVVDASGPEMTRAETVTLLNDLCIFAAAGLVDPAIRWDAVDDRSARATFTSGSNTVQATLVFNDAGELVDFVSDDRLASSPDGKQFTPRRWSTPVGAYRAFGPRRLSTRGEARWHAPAPDGEFAYLTIELQDIAYNVRTR